MTHKTHCTRCARSVPETDLDARFKHGEVIACSACEQAPVESVQQLPETDTADDRESRIKSLDTLQDTTEHLEDAHREFTELCEALALDLEDTGDMDFHLHVSLMKRAENSLTTALRYLDEFKKREGLK